MNTSYSFLTGAASALLALTLIKVVVNNRHSNAGRWLVLLLVGIICYLVRPLTPGGVPLLSFSLELFTLLIPGAFWLFAHALCDEEAPFPLWGWVLIALSCAIHLAATRMGTYDPVGPNADELATLLYSVSQPFKIALVALGMFTLLRQYQSDLVESRRNIRAGLMIFIGIYFVIVICAEYLFEYLPVPANLELLHAIFATLLAFATGYALLALSPGMLNESMPEPVAPAEAHSAAAKTSTEDKTESAEPEVIAPAEQRLLDALKASMDAGGYRQTGLTIRELAEQLGSQEHLLRSLINKRLGFRNFNDFLNKYRLDEASERLALREQQKLPVLSIALDVGYRSISPFNAAFKRRHGVTPTEYRRRHLEGNGDNT
ncbi:helix-turn-helix domain-containing protein [Biformimicrobium ophioploci]|uniref:Helix-turn-helix domain-containing protein n=1 Tax=Biformimicrobium ophioploci TaxID=3036711 RepID=A0ABQ6LYM9_9GAMM|nr:helix-turn-helix domain-containing protein [Microbulbifer sp. NKW57]GMG87204.1 helix-turn-helix domain-containing protein [Microbulbifer sp. NKW57]